MSKNPPVVPQLPMNALDKVIAYISPATAMKRAAARGMLAMTGGYTGARIDKASLNRWMPSAGSPEVDINADLRTLRARSRDQMRNAPVALGALETTVSHVVGTGLSVAPAILTKYLGITEEAAEEWQDDTRFRFEEWCGSLDCDVSRNLNFYGIQELAFRSTLESGDHFVLTPRIARAGAAARLALQLIEADRVCNDKNKPNTPTLIDGIELAESTNEAVAVWVARNHPGGCFASNNSWTRVPMRGDSTGRRNVLHLFKQLRPGQTRGVPWIAPILEPLKQLERYTEAELNSAVVSALFSVFVKMDGDDFQDLFDEDAQGEIVDQASNWSGEMESGKAIRLLPGESIESTNPGRPNAQFDPFVQAILRQIGMALQIPYEVLVMHYQSSYSAARASLLMAWKFFRSRRDWLSTYLCRPVYELWLAEEIMEGRISAPGFFASPIIRAAWCGAAWIGDGPGSIDPEKEVRAAKARVELEISTLEEESIAHNGVGWKAKHLQRKKELDAQRRDGTLLTAAAAPASPAEPQNEGDDTVTGAPA